MNLVIWKYGLTMKDGLQILSLPERAQIVHVGMQDSEMMLWALVDPVEQNKEARLFQVIGTGQQIEAKNMHWRHLGTTFSGPFVWHVMERVI